MNALALQQTQASSLPALVREAARKLAGAETSADALEIEALAKRRVAGSSLAVMFLFIAAMRYMMRRRP